jgi:TonB family protein
MRFLEAALLSYLFNALWQVPLIFTAAWLAARLVRGGSVLVEHRIWTSALILQAVLPACPEIPVATMPAAWRFIAGLWQHTFAPAGTQVTVTSTFTPLYHRSSLHLSAHLLSAIASIYICVWVYCGGRLIYCFCKTHQLRHTAQLATLTGHQLRSWCRCATIFHVSNARFATSARIGSPSTIGIRDHMVLLPSAMPDALSNDDLDAALAHEFAHMQRRDFALNLFYQFIALPLAWHPLLWLTFARIAETHEMLCDDLAAQSLCGPDRKADYARSLLRLATLLLHGSSIPTHHAIGIFDANIFERRLMYLTAKPIEVRAVRRFATTSLCVLLGLGACTSALALRTAVSGPNPRQALAPAQPIPHVSGGVIAGSRISFVNPVYPPDAKAAKLSGTVILHAVIGKDGTIEQLTVVSGPEVFQQSALQAVHHWTYKPFLLQGEPTEVDTTITVNYSMRK